MIFVRILLSFYNVYLLESERESETSAICQFSSQMPEITSAGPVQSQELPTWVQGAVELWPSSVFPGH